jgi:DNA-binding helix-hairpin-helix protein with protein kinase domain
MQPLYDESGRSVSIGAKLGEGGEGSVYRLANKPALAVKIYTKPMSADQVAKIRTLSEIRDATLDRFTAWPVGLVLDSGRSPRGFLLPVIEAGQDVHQLYTPSSRRQHFPDADWRFIVHVAINVARAFASVHQHRLVIGDVNPKSLLVLGDGTVRLIDVDSFQVWTRAGRYLLCTVAMPHFLPPELHGKPLSSEIRTENHDGFGLAVTLFQLLLLGRHPYAGRHLHPGDMPIERAISENRFAYSVDAAKRGIDRPPNTVGPEILPASLGGLFETAFSASSDSNSRPTAAAWSQELGSLARALTRCTQSGKHYYFRKLTTCPWCSLEAKVGLTLFGISSSVNSTRTQELQFEELLTRAQAATPSPVTAVTPKARPPAAADAVAAATMPRTGWVAGAVGVVLIVVALLLSNRALGVPIFLVGASGALLGFGAKPIRQHRWRKLFHEARTQHRLAQEQLDVANTFPEYSAAARNFSNKVQMWRQLPVKRSEQYRKLEADKRNLQHREFLETQNIAAATIKGIGPTLVAMLSSYGFDTAADIGEHRLMQVPGIGPKRAQALIAWRQARSHRFVFDPAKPIPRESIARLEAELEKERRHVLGSLRSAFATVQSAADSSQQIAAQAARRVGETASKVIQAEANVRAATGAVPK